ncbi:MAG: metabolite traffic protein EboE [Planctomycetes bacterium]|nr:metabolite traffic protein EboE [Planctomycetota bacterium]
MPELRLTYCGNVHAAPDFAALLAGMREHTVPVARAARVAGRSFGMGAWWPQDLVARLRADPGARTGLVAAMRELDLPLWTLNVFPVGGFHDAVVKTAVYRPDWADEARLDHTRSSAELAASLCAAGTVLPLSTLPLGYRGPREAPADLRVMARNLARCASAFAAIEQATGVCCVLALEPEPDCLLETAAGTAAFLEQWLFDEGAWTTVPEAVLRRHLGVCVDLCHLAVVGEDALQALRDLRGRGIAVPKIQVSACLEVRTAAGLDELLAFAEPRYLHQTVAADGTRALDLPEVAAARAKFAAGGRIRSHYHVPLFWDRPGPFGSTQQEVARVLRGLCADAAPLPLLEVETYTWGVLGDFAGKAPLADRIAHELQWVAQQLAADHPGSGSVSCSPR